MPSDGEFLDLYLDLVRQYVSRDVALVAEFVLTARNAEAFADATLGAEKTVLLLRAADAAERYEQRLRTDPFIAAPAVQRALGPEGLAHYLRRAHQMVAECEAELIGGESIGATTLAVDTTDGYRPGVDEIVRHVREAVGAWP
jgi:hypothetical protein